MFSQYCSVLSMHINNAERIFSLGRHKDINHFIIKFIFNILCRKINI